jgi:hypothetical protein
MNASTPSKQIQIQIQLVDGAGKSCEFSMGYGKNGFSIKPTQKQRGFGLTAPTESCTISGAMLTGDAWRFIEGTLGEQSLFDHLVKDGVDAGVFLANFQDRFNDTQNDAEAMVMWDEITQSVVEDDENSPAAL